MDGTGPSHPKKQRMITENSGVLPVTIERYNDKGEYRYGTKRTSTDIVEFDTIVIKEEPDSEIKRELSNISQDNIDPYDYELGNSREMKQEEFTDNDDNGNNSFLLDDEHPLSSQRKLVPPQPSPVAPTVPPTPAASEDHHQLDHSSDTSGWTVKGELKNIEFTKRNKFSGNITGVKPIDYFNFFFPDEFLTMICTDTNAQAQRLLLSSSKVFSKVTKWKDLTVPELRIFLGLLFHMGTIATDHIRDYWRRDRLFSINIFGQQMSGNRFFLILRCLHFTSDPNIHDPLYKVRKVIDFFNSKMTECYYPAKQLTLNSSKISWRGQLYNEDSDANKPKNNSSGVKLYTLMEPDGLVLKIHARSGGKHNEAVIEEVVMHLMDGKLHSGHELYMGSYYNSFSLAKTLLDNGTYCTGTLRKKLKDISGLLLRWTLENGKSYSLFRDGVQIGKWQDKTSVLYITTKFDNVMTRFMVGKGGQSITKPEALVKYHQYMMDGSRQEHLHSSYPLERKSLRWDLKITIHIFQLLMVNSFLLYNKYSGQKNINLYDYRVCVIDELLPENPGTIPVSEDTAHQIKAFSKVHAKGRKMRRACQHCWLTQRKRTDTLWYCATCPDQPGLCVGCFDYYHTQSWPPNHSSVNR